MGHESRSVLVMASPGSRSPMLVIRNAQLAVFEELHLQQFETSMLPHLQRFFPMDSALLGEPQLRAVIRQAARNALSRSFHEQGQVCRYIDLSLSLGTDFPRDPLLPWAESHAGARGGSFQSLYDDAIGYIEAVSGETGQYAMRAILRARALSFAEMANPNADTADTLRLLSKLWPQKFRRLRPVDQTRFLALADALSRNDGLWTSGPQRLYTILMFMLGSYFAVDATIPWARAALMQTAASPDARARALYDAAMGFIDRFIALLPSQAGR